MFWNDISDCVILTAYYLQSKILFDTIKIHKID